VIPFGDEVIRAEPSEIVIVCDDYDRFVDDPLEEELWISWCVLVPTFAETLVELLREVLTGRWESV
jgi:hypothetical protein